MSTPPPRHRVALVTATSITVANMIGTGVFTSLGFQVVDLRSGFSLVLLWLIGGVFALCGALSYAELAAALPRSGGEFHFLSRALSPALGFLAGWVSVTVGFALPIALAAIAFGRYFSRVVPGASPLWTSLLVVAGVTLFHLRDLRLGSAFQNVATLFKVLLVLFFIGAAGHWKATRAGDAAPDIDFLPTRDSLGEIMSAPFGVALLFVMYAYSGWNAATYIVGEVRDPERNVPRALFLGTALVTVLYVLLNAAFLATTPIAALVGKVEVGHVVAEQIFGARGGAVMSALLCLALVSSISAMTWAGPRVTQIMGEDLAFFRPLAKTNPAGIPVRAIALQTAIVLLMLLTSTFDKILVYVQFTLTASSALAVAGVFALRWREPDLERPYRVWGYPVVPALFLLISGVTLVYTFVGRPWESLLGLATVLVALPIYWLSPRSSAA